MRHKNKMPSLTEFLTRLYEFIAQAPKGYQYAIEIRNPNFLTPQLYEFLSAHNLGFVYLEGYYMPPIDDIFRQFISLTADFSVIRLHGGGSAPLTAERFLERLFIGKPYL